MLDATLRKILKNRLAKLNENFPDNATRKKFGEIANDIKVGNKEFTQIEHSIECLAYAIDVARQREEKTTRKSLRGILSKYADPDKIKNETYLPATR